MHLVDDAAIDAGFGIYIHWPFCEAKCPYCDFNSHVARQIDHRVWAKAYVAELERYREELGPVPIQSVFFGGGTPSLMEPEIVETILLCLSESWGFAQKPEITMEANPSSVESGRFRDYRNAGVNRISLGIQSLNDDDLKSLGRIHTADEGRRAISIAQEVFPRVSFDLMYARQNQSLAAWQSELAEALSFGVTHLSLYQLTIENGTAFGRRFKKGKLPGLPDQDLAADMYLVTQDATAAAGLPAYEISNHAADGAQSRHNLIYWRGGDYVGIGPGAHGRIAAHGQRIATDTPLEPEAWLAAVECGSGDKSRETLTARDTALEYLMMSLRLVEGCDLRRLPSTFLNMAKINELRDMGALEMTNSHLRATEQGRALLNYILTEIWNDD